MEPGRTFMRKAKIDMFYNQIPILQSYRTEKCFKADHSKKFKSSHKKLMKTIIKTQNFNGTWENLHEKSQN